MPGMDNLPTLSQTVRLYGLGANKKLGQHFLLDMNVTDMIARLALPLEGVHVAEIGPGPGGLTRSLLKAGAEAVTVIEMDEQFLPALKAIADVSDNRLSIIKGDALSVDIATELGPGKPIKIAANLPYNVGTKMLINWLTADPLFWDQAVLMFQKEVAQRIVAAPGESAYSRLAILAQSVCTCRMAFDVPAKSFSPPPKVDSAVVVLEPLPEAERFSNLKLLGELTRAAFGQRRKMLRKSLKPFAKKYGLDLETWLAAKAVNPTDRPETLPISAFQELAKSVSLSK
ncbi:MAG: 16S rRNA (adenine(1518)-N(6)/adenine(1519)-N(6))-dimethyltransferase RsmA [Hellea sp.]|nr:16S rRNA (adenine(1518)-N(6)/adenine(1519)-N(6))-dimethyltransferase RsmA [Hellea sp.]